MLNEYYTLQEVAEALQVDRRTIYKYVAEGKLKTYKLGREHRVTEEQIKEFLENKPAKASRKNR